MTGANYSPEAVHLLRFARQITATNLLFRSWDESRATLHAVGRISATEMIIFPLLTLEAATCRMFIGC